MTLTADPAWKRLVTAAQGPLDMRDMFKEDPQRFEKFSLQLNPEAPGGPLLIDYSKNKVTAAVLKDLLEVARNRNLKQATEAMFTGKRINSTEDRAVLHVALRAHLTDEPILVDGQNVIPQVHSVLEKVKKFTTDVINGTWTGYTGSKITDVVNIGIGGSDLGPCMVSEALADFQVGPRVHFVSNVDESHLTHTVKTLNPATTLFIIASKTFTTQETLANAHSARSWFLNNGGKEVNKHFVALSTNDVKVKEFGIETAFEFWDWVGGRYSLWSSIGLSIALYIGFDNFRQLLDGARWMDHHFRTAPFESNAPVLLAMLGVFYGSILKYETHAILPYDQLLSKLPAYLQQADMESNGKSVQINGSPVEVQTGPIIWGAAGTNGQHAFYQLIHQGTRIIPCDFIGFAKKPATLGVSHHTTLLANFIAQPEALLMGRTDVSKLPPNLQQHKYFPGNRPSTSILASTLTPFTLGSIIALYEHKIFTQGVIWGVNSFDQWGVELGKELAKAVEPELASGKVGNHDGSTAGLMRWIVQQ